MKLLGCYYNWGSKMISLVMTFDRYDKRSNNRNLINYNNFNPFKMYKDELDIHIHALSYRYIILF